MFMMRKKLKISVGSGQQKYGMMLLLPGNLLRKAQSRLNDLVKGVTSIQLTIVDESDTGADIGDIHARMYVECISKPHGINGTYICVNRTRDYLNPAGNTITIGASGISLSQATVNQDKKYFCSRGRYSRSDK